MSRSAVRIRSVAPSLIVCRVMGYGNVFGLQSEDASRRGEHRGNSRNLFVRLLSLRDDSFRIPFYRRLKGVNWFRTACNSDKGAKRASISYRDNDLEALMKVV